MNLIEATDDIYNFVEQHGWHNKTNIEYLGLIGSEIGEAINECRGDEPTDNFRLELADILLRCFDFFKVHKSDIERALHNLDVTLYTIRKWLFFQKRVNIS